MHWEYLLLMNNKSKSGVNSEDYFKLMLKRCGSENKDKIIYYIYEDGENLGFFAMYRAWLEYLYFADVCGYTPVVQAGKNFPYRENMLVHGTGNPFEYYFDQPAVIQIQEAKESNKVITSDLIHRQMVELVLTGKYSHYKYTDRYMNEMAQIVEKYVRFNNYTMKYINKGMGLVDFEKEKVFGIHVRGTDFRAKYDNHPVYVSEEEFFREIDRIFDKNTYTKIFLATDDERTLKKFTERYGSLVVFYRDVERSRSNQSVAFGKGKRKAHKYLLGLEVIRDMYALSMCKGLIAGISQVAICAQIHKLARGEHYNDLRIIDKGINVNHHSFIRYGGK